MTDEMTNGKPIYNLGEKKLCWNTNELWAFFESETGVLTEVTQNGGNWNYPKSGNDWSFRDTTMSLFVYYFDVVVECTSKFFF
jgi:hypothetical protein